MIFLIISIAILIVIIFGIAQYTRESKLKKIAQTLLLGLIPLSDKERKSFFIKKPNLF